MDGGPPGSPVPGILQARIRERGATAFSYQREKVRVLHTEVFGVFFFSFPQMMLLDKSGYFCSDIAQHLYMVHVEIMIKD